jgi:general secretion pathway protein A
MVLRHFKLREQPFGVTPDPRYLYASSTHREALSSILYGVEAGLGFITLIGMPGTGKTTLLFEAMRRLEEKTRTVFLFQAIFTPAELVRALLIDLGVKDVQGSLAEMQAQLNEVLVAQCATGKRLVVAIDEAQNLNYSVLESVRMLSNFETASYKLMQIILSGQPQLAEKLALPHLLQLRQRISIFGHLKPLSLIETRAYVNHRLRIAGYDSAEPIFTSSALALIARHSEGIPRNINNICFNALTLGCALKRKTIDSDVIKEVMSDLDVSRCCVAAPAPEVAKKSISHAAIAKRSTRVAQSKLRAFCVAAVSCALLLSLGWLALHWYPAISAEGSVSARTNDASLAGSVPIPQTKVIGVKKGQSLDEICTENFGVCRPEVLREIIRINSSIRNPDHIRSGQKISIPSLVQASAENK